MTGEIPTELGNLTILALSENQLTGHIPRELSKLTNLTILALYENELTGPIPRELNSLANLQELYLWDNKLTGAIPTKLSNLTNLTILALSDNQLTGPIPRELGNLTNLTILALSDNQLTGEIPAELGNLSNLTQLYLHENQLTGPIPADLGNLSNLTGLYLQENQLTGTIPAELGRLAGLLELSLRDNQLSGAIPPELSNLTKLERLSLSQNMLTGCVPEAWRDIKESDVPGLGLPFCTIDLNTAPVFSDSESNPITEAGRSVVENTAAGENVGTPVAATDNNDDTLTYALGGTDAASFDINPLTGQLMTQEALDYETKDSYEVMVTATDPEGASDMIMVTITVTNVDELGTVSGEATFSYAENGTDAVGTYTADGPDAASATWSLSGDDAEDFTITGGVLAFSSPPDYENPADADGDNVYMVTVQANAGGEMGEVPITVTVTDVAMPMELLTRYDDNNNNEIDLDEVFTAIDDYFDYDDRITLAEIYELIDLYFDG